MDFFEISQSFLGFFRILSDFFDFLPYSRRFFRTLPNSLRFSRNFVGFSRILSDPFRVPSDLELFSNFLVFLSLRIPLLFGFSLSLSSLSFCRLSFSLQILSISSSFLFLPRLSLLLRDSLFLAEFCLSFQVVSSTYRFSRFCRPRPCIFPGCVSSWVFSSPFRFLFIFYFYPPVSFFLSVFR